MADYEIMDGVEFPPSRLDTLALRMANAVLDGTYESARRAASDRANLIEYAAHETKDDERRNTQVGNFTRKIIKTLGELGYDKCGLPLKPS